MAINLRIELTQSGDAPEDPKGFRLGSRDSDFHDEVGRVAGRRENALALRGLVKRTFVRRTLRNLSPFDGYQMKLPKDRIRYILCACDVKLKVEGCTDFFSHLVRNLYPATWSL